MLWISARSGEPFETHMVHVLRIDVTEDPESGLNVEFVHIMASPWDSPWWIVSVEGDVIAAYACELKTKPLSQFVVWIANWRTATAAVVHLPEDVIHVSVFHDMFEMVYLTHGPMCSYRHGQPFRSSVVRLSFTKSAVALLHPSSFPYQKPCFPPKAQILSRRSK